MQEARKKAARFFYIKKWQLFDTGVGARLPEAYKKFHREWTRETPKPVHYRPTPGRFIRHPKTGIVQPVQNIPLPTRFPLELNETLLGGEMVIQGFQKRNPTKRRVPHFWVPVLRKSVVYSEVLDRHVSCSLTQRLIHLIHEHKGFDYYLLQNKACDLKTLLALKMKREILIALRDKTLPYDEKKNERIYQKYKDFLLTDEEVDWYGLSYKEACDKLLREEKANTKILPLKEIYRQELLNEMRAAGIEEAQALPQESSGWLSKVKNPFSTKQS